MRPDDPRPRPALEPLSQDARLDRALSLPRLPDPVHDRSEPGDDARLAPDGARRRGDRPPLRRDAPALARALPRPARGRAAARLRRALRAHLGLLPRLL